MFDEEGRSTGANEKIGRSSEDISIAIGEGKEETQTGGRKDYESDEQNGSGSSVAEARPRSCQDRKRGSTAKDEEVWSGAPFHYSDTGKLSLDLLKLKRNGGVGREQ